jgi:hypothetical protein
MKKVIVNQDKKTQIIIKIKIMIEIKKTTEIMEDLVTKIIA